MLLAIEKNDFQIRKNAVHLFMWLFFVLAYSLLGVIWQLAFANEDQNQSREDLEWGVVLYEFFQRDYFNGLVEHEYAQSINNRISLSPEGELLKGGMLLSYSVSDESRKIFEKFLSGQGSEKSRNRAWFYLANLYYHKADKVNAKFALSNIKGQLQENLLPEYHYLSTLILDDTTLPANFEKNISRNSSFYPYTRFNLGIRQLRVGDIAKSVESLEAVTTFPAESEELANLVDRARHGLAQIALQNNRTDIAWNYLNAIRTTGLYSNRALLTYAWTAIELKKFNDAIPALRILEERDIAIPEVQEARVLLAHLYEQEGSPRKALKSNLLAIKAFEEGVKRIEDARLIIAKHDVPREYIKNLQSLKKSSDWYGAKPSINYLKLTPFILDLLSSNAFSETLRELADLYALQENLEYWLFQAKEHRLIYQSAEQKSFERDKQQSLEKSEKLKVKLHEKQQELKLYLMTLSVEEQKRFDALLTSTKKQMDLLDSRLEQLKNVEGAYKQPVDYLDFIIDKHQKIEEKLKEAIRLILILEPVMRDLVNSELDKHEDRMRYYWAQSRLAKARLYDTMLMDLDKVQPVKPTQDAVDEETTP
ncbi:MAG: hypothetical protein AAGB12_08315 [Pseudomonadota bacterium]